MPAAVLERRVRQPLYDTPIPLSYVNATSFFLREGEVRLRDGWCVAQEIPPAAFGTLAIYARSQEDVVDVVGSGPGEVVEFDGRDEETLSQAIGLLHQFKDGGLDLVDVSMGFSLPKTSIPWGPAMMAPTAARVRRETGLPTATSWFISEPAQADGLIQDGTVDLVMLGRPLLAEPHWPYRAAKELGIDKAAWVLPAPYAHWLERYR